MRAEAVPISETHSVAQGWQTSSHVPLNLNPASTWPYLLPSNWWTDCNSSCSDSHTGPMQRILDLLKPCLPISVKITNPGLDVHLHACSVCSIRDTFNLKLSVSLCLVNSSCTNVTWLYVLLIYHDVNSRWFSIYIPKKLGLSVRENLGSKLA